MKNAIEKLIAKDVEIRLVKIDLAKDNLVKMKSNELLLPHVINQSTTNYWCKLYGFTIEQLSFSLINSYCSTATRFGSGYSVNRYIDKILRLIKHSNILLEYRVNGYTYTHKLGCTCSYAYIAVIEHVISNIKKSFPKLSEDAISEIVVKILAGIELKHVEAFKSLIRCVLPTLLQTNLDKLTSG